MDYVRRLSLVLMLGAPFVGGCMSNDMNDLTMYADKIKKRPPGRIEPLPEVKQVETFIYIPGDRRNPFEKPDEPDVEQVDAPSDNGIAPDPFRRKEELEAFPLDTIRMVGTMDQAGTMWGLVMSGGIIYRVKVGNYMGQNHGQIMRITEEKIELTEIVPDGKGGYRERRANMALATE